MTPHFRSSSAYKRGSRSGKQRQWLLEGLERVKLVLLYLYCQCVLTFSGMAMTDKQDQLQVKCALAVLD